MNDEFFDIFLDDIVVIDIPTLICPKIKSAYEIERDERGKYFDKKIANIRGKE